MAHAESNRSPSPTRDGENAEPTRAAYQTPRLTKLNLTETEGSSGLGGDGGFFAVVSGPN